MYKIYPNRRIELSRIKDRVWRFEITTRTSLIETITKIASMLAIIINVKIFKTKTSFLVI